MKNAICLLAIASLLACSKDEGPGFLTPGDCEYRFDYKGRTYTGSDYIIQMDSDKNLRELFMYASGLFGGAIRYFPSIGCGFMVPDGMQWEWSPTYMNPQCRLTVNGLNIIDSARIYFYRSGSVQYAVRAREFHSGYMLDGTHSSWDECTVSGTFSLILCNKYNDRIEISNGSFRYEKFRIYR